MNPNAQKAVLWGGVLLLPLFLILLNLKLVAFNESFYNAQYEANGVYNQLSRAAVEEATQAIFSFLRAGDPLPSSLFTERERKHMQDVRMLYALSSIIWWSTLISLVMVMKCLNKWQRGTLCRYGSILTLAAVVIMALLAINFTSFWTGFHELFFWNELWMLPSSATLIALFPEAFFQALIAAILKSTAALAVVMIAAEKSLRHQGC